MPLTLRPPTPHRTKQEFVYSTLRRAIMSCELAPGERLVIDELGRRLGVSAIPVREALQMLQSEGLVVTVPHVGATVAPISRDSIAEVFTLMEGLEVVAARAAVRRAGPADVEALAATVAEMDRALAAGRHEEWGDLNTRFHLGLCALAGMPMLHEMMERVLDHWDRLRRYFFSGVLAHRLELAQKEHHALVKALAERDDRALETTLREHNQGALAAYTAYLQGAAASASA
jgi:DNA-binding GntR family transcriptional regulator